MKKLLLVFIPLLLASCQKELVEPIDVFEKEELTDTLSLDLGSHNGDNTLLVNSDRIQETESGYHIKGTIFSRSVSGVIPLTSGEFIVHTNGSGLKSTYNELSFTGYGTADFPPVGLLAGLDIEEIPGADVYYNTGRIFKQESKSGLLPLKDEQYYFRYKFDKGKNKKKGKEFRKGRVTLALEEYFQDPSDPAVICTGSLYSNNRKTGIKTSLIEHGAVGISANEQWEYKPLEFSERLEEITGGTGFEAMNGGLYLGGIIPVKKYPLKIQGEAVISTSYSSQGTDDFFTRGFEESSFRLGVNGELFFSNQLMSFLPVPDTIKLGQAALQAEFSDETSAIRMAGQYSTDCLSQFLGPEMTRLLPHTSREGLLYARCTDDPEDFLVYLEQKVSVSVPGMGNMALQNSIFSVSKDSVGFSGFMSLPYGIGEVDVKGRLYSDGSFLLKGTATSGIDLGGGLAYDAALDIEISNEGIVFSGNMDLPYNLLQAEIEGGLTLDEVWFTGSMDGKVGFSDGVSLSTHLALTASSKTGIALEGGVNLPANIGTVAIYGELFYDHFALSGIIQAGLDMDFYNLTIETGAEMSLTVDSRSGVYFEGNVDFPFNFGSVYAFITIEPGNVLEFGGAFDTGLEIAGVSVFNIDFKFTASTTNGLHMEGDFHVPGGIGDVSGNGSITNHGFYFYGTKTGFDFDFEIISLSTEISLTVTNHSVKIKASGSGSVAGVKYNPSISVQPDWGSGHVQLCIDFVLGDACLKI